MLNALPAEVAQVIVIADRGFARAPFFRWLQQRGVDFVIRLPRGALLTDRQGRRLRLGQDGLRFGQRQWHPQMHYGVDDRGRPREIEVNLLRLWQAGPGGRRPKEPGIWPVPWLRPGR